MRPFALLLLLLPVSAAMAQDVGDTAWIVGDVESVRFLGDVTPGPSLNADTEVQVLAVADGKVRVMVGDRFGWVDAAALTTTRPEGAAPSRAPVPIQLTPQ